MHYTTCLMLHKQTLSPQRFQYSIWSSWLPKNSMISQQCNNKEEWLQLLIASSYLEICDVLGIQCWASKLTGHQLLLETGRNRSNFLLDIANQLLCGLHNQNGLTTSFMPFVHAVFKPGMCRPSARVHLGFFKLPYFP